MYFYKSLKHKEHTSMKISLVGDAILKSATKAVSASEIDSIMSIIPEMERIMLAAGGIGLAANQVGISKSFFIMGAPIKVYINPVIVDSSSKEVLRRV